MKLVLDTNVLVSGIFWAGPPGAINDAWVNGRHALLITPDILFEYIRVISEVGGDADVTARWTRQLMEASVMVTPKAASLACRDIDDQKFLECALGGTADFIISGDNDLLVLGNIEGIPIVRARTFVDNE